MNSQKIKTNLKDYAYNKFSQNGEDGIIQEILKRLNLKNSDRNWCVEFGAWDGIYLSNTYNLVLEGWNAVYIEGDESKYRDLLNTIKKHKKIIPINAFIAKDKSSKFSLDNLLKQTNVPINFDLLSIDIDSFDLEVWESVNIYNPKIVIIEINSSYPPGIIKWHSNKYKNSNGNSFSATLKVAKNKNYDLVCHTGNMIFVKSNLVKELNLNDKYLKYPELLYDDLWFSLEREIFLLKFIRRLIAFIKVKFLNKIKNLITHKR